MRKAAEGGFARAMNELGMAYRCSDALQHLTSLSQSLSYLTIYLRNITLLVTKVCTENEWRGLCGREGSGGLAVDEHQATEWFRRAISAAAEPEAQFNLAQQLLQGHGSPATR